MPETRRTTQHRASQNAPTTVPSFSEDFVADNDPFLADAGRFKVEWINDEEEGDDEEEDGEDADDVAKAPQFRKDVRFVFLR